MSDKLAEAASHAAATIGAIYQWVDHINANGGPTCIAGVAACNAMLQSLEKNRVRCEELIMKPLREAIKESME